MKEIHRTIRSYVQRSAGNCNQLTDHTLRCFVGMVETGEATIDDFETCFDGLGRIVSEAKAKLDKDRCGK